MRRHAFRLVSVLTSLLLFLPMTNEEIEEVWKLVPVGTPVEIRP
jgi:hypothetical protein